MSRKHFVIVGATAPDALKLAQAIDRAGTDHFSFEGFLDDDPAKTGAEFMGYPIVGTTAALENRLKDCWVVNNVARDMPTRLKVARRLDALNVTRRLTLVHPSVDVEHVEIGPGCIIQEGVVLGPLTRISRECMLYAHAVIGHECVLGEAVFVANNAIVGARGTVGDGAFIGLSSVILPYLSIGAWSTIGAGSIVLKDVDANSAVFGNPARAAVRPAALAKAS